MIGYYDRGGRPITRDEWTTKFEDHDYKVVEQTFIRNRYLVSTVWLGLDHQMWPGAPPMIFETMVFDGEHSRDDLTMQRYSTEAQARVGHAEMVAEVKSWKKKR